jgi:hypothetical protein
LEYSKHSLIWGYCGERSRPDAAMIRIRDAKSNKRQWKLQSTKMNGNVIIKVQIRKKVKE